MLSLEDGGRGLAAAWIAKVTRAGRDASKYPRGPGGAQPSFWGHATLISQKSSLLVSGRESQPWDSTYEMPSEGLLTQFSQLNGILLKCPLGFYLPDTCLVLCFSFFFFLFQIS